ncbi:MAG: dTDP-4-dehydrorhamnose 3,5-epimerase family protein [Bdellovibrionales bacterium]|nr:dTDP-4-dehydrorhamnose 3,5-epimerase family protein [Bdellovibrionales bacterium]
MTQISNTAFPKAAEFTPTSIAGLFRFRFNTRFQDERGVFVKPLHLDFLKQHGIQFECRESFISYSKQSVLRGMHFQIPPHGHDKIVSCVDGEIFDVVVDLRQNSKTFGKFEAFTLKGESGDALFIPEGCAHGFQSVSKDGTWVAYYTSREHHADSDKGILWSSVPAEWPIIGPIVNARDSAFPPLEAMKDAKYFK